MKGGDSLKNSEFNTEVLWSCILSTGQQGATQFVCKRKSMEKSGPVIHALSKYFPVELWDQSLVSLHREQNIMLIFYIIVSVKLQNNTSW